MILLFTFKDIVLKYEAGRWWITNTDDEGMEMSEKNMYDMLKRETEENL